MGRDGYGLIFSTVVGRQDLLGSKARIDVASPIDGPPFVHFITADVGVGGEDIIVVFEADVDRFAVGTRPGGSGTAIPGVVVSGTLVNAVAIASVVDREAFGVVDGSGEAIEVGFGGVFGAVEGQCFTDDCRQDGPEFAPAVVDIVDGLVVVHDLGNAVGSHGAEHAVGADVEAVGVFATGEADAPRGAGGDFVPLVGAVGPEDFGPTAIGIGQVGQGPHRTIFGDANVESKTGRGLGVEYSIRIDCKDGKVISDSPKGVDIAFGVRHGEKRIEK